MSIVNPFAGPGMGTPAETTEREFLWGNRDTPHLESAVIVSTAVDATNSPTTTLRRSLLMGRITATGKLIQYASTATDGSQVVAGVLYEARNMLDNTTGSAIDQQGQIVVNGFVKADQLLGFDAQARQQMRGRFLFDDDYAGYYSPEFVKEVTKAADYTIVAADRGTLFTVSGSGAVIFTLPALAPSLKFGFYNTVDQDMSIISAGSADNIICFNDLGADSIAFSSSGNKIGAFVVVFSNAAGTKWYVEQRCKHTLTVA